MKVEQSGYKRVVEKAVTWECQLDGSKAETKAEKWEIIAAGELVARTVQ